MHRRIWVYGSAAAAAEGQWLGCTAPLPARPADINGESATGPAPSHYRTNLASLASLVLYGFSGDLTVVPKESSHFGWCGGRPPRCRSASAGRGS